MIRLKGLKNSSKKSTIIIDKTRQDKTLKTQNDILV